MKQKAVLILTFQLASLLSVFAENIPNDAEKGSMNTFTVCGIVLDKISSEPLVGVRVKIEGTTREVFTNFDGKFEFVNLKQSEYVFSFKLVTYKEFKTGNIAVNKDAINSDFTFQLIPVNDKPKLKQENNEVNALALNAG